MQLDAALVDRLHENGWFVQVETNGTLPLPGNVDWVTCSPKTDRIACGRVDEIKLLYIWPTGTTLNAWSVSALSRLAATHCSLVTVP